MSQEFIKLQEFSANTLFYGTTNVVFAAADNSISKTGIGTNTPAGQEISISSAEDTANDGVWTCSSVSSADKIIVTGGTITGNTDDDTAVLKGQISTGWIDVSLYSRIVAIISSNQNATITLQWASSKTGTAAVSAATNITGGTPTSVASETLAKFLRIRIITNAAATATVTGTVWAKATT
jgi:hypothetical protein